MSPLAGSASQSWPLRALLCAAAYHPRAALVVRPRLPPRPPFLDATCTPRRQLSMSCSPIRRTGRYGSQLHPRSMCDLDLRGLKKAHCTSPTSCPLHIRAEGYCRANEVLALREFAALNCTLEDLYGLHQNDNKNWLSDNFERD